MESSVSSFILVVATVLIGIVLFGLLSSYIATQAAITDEIREAQALASSLQIRDQISNNEAIVVPYLPGYSQPIYIVAFNVTSNVITAESLSFITPSMGTPINNLNYTEANLVTLTIYSASDKEIYTGQVYLYNTTSTSVTIVPLQPNSYTILWFLANIDGKLYRIGYLEL